MARLRDVREYSDCVEERKAAERPERGALPTLPGRLRSKAPVSVPSAAGVPTAAAEAFRIIRSTGNPTIDLEATMNLCAGAFLVPGERLREVVGAVRRRTGMPQESARVFG